MFEIFTPEPEPPFPWSAVLNVIGAVALWIGLSLLAELLAPRGWPHELAKLAIAAILVWLYFPEKPTPNAEDLE